jgi:type I restriction enzyme S subunit
MRTVDERTAKPSNVEWIGDVPRHWKVARTKYVARLESGHTPSRQRPEYWANCHVPWITLADVWQLRDRTQKYITETAETISELGLANSSARLLPKDTVILSRTASVGFSAIMGQAMATSQDFVNWVCGPKIVPDFLLYVFRAMRHEFDRLVRGSIHQTIYMPVVEKFMTPLPPMAEQRAIAAFLDRKTAQIDELIAKKQRLLDLLHERKSATISHAIAGRLRSDIPTKDSGSTVWGRIPAHWRMTELRHLTPDNRQIMYGIVLPGPDVDDGIPIVKGGNCEPGRLRLDCLSRTTREIESGYVRSRLKRGDIVYAIRGSIGQAEIVPPELEGANLTQDAARISPKSGVDGRWLLRAVRSHAFFLKLDAGATGATIRGINIRDLKRAAIAVPPSGEQ